MAANQTDSGEFDAEDKHRAYREKARQYADEEKRLWEDSRHRIIIGTKGFVDKVRSKYMPNPVQKEIPDQRSLGRRIDPETVPAKGAGILKCDMDVIRRSRKTPRLL